MSYCNRTPTIMPNDELSVAHAVTAANRCVSAKSHFRRFELGAQRTPIPSLLRAAASSKSLVRMPWRHFNTVLLVGDNRTYRETQRKQTHDVAPDDLGY